jgi:stage II sporulation protein P
MELIRPTRSFARVILRTGLPHLQRLEEPAPKRGMLLFGTGRGGERAPQRFFDLVLPFLARQEHLAQPEPSRLPPGTSGPDGATPPTPAPAPVPPGPEPAHEPAKPQPSEPPPPPVPSVVLVGIYHTHDWESFLSEHPNLTIKTEEDLARVRTLDENRNILRIGRVLGQRLSEAGVAVVQNPASHEKAGYSEAYRESRKTARQILADYPSVRILLDIHRDSVPRSMSTAQIGGKQVARIQIVLGVGGSGLPHPRWKENHAFAQLLHREMERKYPGLSRGLLLKQDRYNQDLLPGALLLEIGSALNSMAEGEEAARLLADVLTEIVEKKLYPE